MYTVSRLRFEAKGLIFTSGDFETIIACLLVLKKDVTTLLSALVLVSLVLIAEIANRAQFVRITPSLLPRLLLCLRSALVRLTTAFAKHVSQALLTLLTLLCQFLLLLLLLLIKLSLHIRALLLPLVAQLLLQ